MSDEKLKVDRFQKYEFDFVELDGQGWFCSCRIPSRIAVCPCCDSQLIANCEEWYLDENFNVWMPEDVKVDCVRGLECYREYENSPYWTMPYVYQLPTQERAARWVKGMVRIYHGILPVPRPWLGQNAPTKLLFMKNGELVV